MTPPTHRQFEVLTIIAAHIRAHGWAPTVHELCAALGITSTNGMQDHLIALERKGMLVRGGAPRALALTHHARRLLAAEKRAE